MAPRTPELACAKALFSKDETGNMFVLIVLFTKIYAVVGAWLKVPNYSFLESHLLIYVPF